MKCFSSVFQAEFASLIFLLGFYAGSQAWLGKSFYADTSQIGRLVLQDSKTWSMIAPQKTHFLKKQRKCMGELLGKKNRAEECVTLEGKTGRKKL